MLFNYYLLKESISDFQEKENVCFYHSFYLYLHEYYSKIISFEEFLQFKNTNNYFTSIQEFIEDYPLLYDFLIKKDIHIKPILDNLVLGIATLENNKAKLNGFIKLKKNINEKNLLLKYILNKTDKPIILLNQNEHFDPIMLKNI